MALQKQQIPIPLGQGINTKVDKKQQFLNTLRRAENVLFETIGKMRKRYGYDKLQLRNTNNDVITGANRVAAFKNELEIFASNRLYSLSDTLQQVVDKGPLYAVEPVTKPVLHSSLSHVWHDMYENDTLQVFAYVNSANEVRYSVLDKNTGSIIVSNDLVGTGTRVKIATLNNYAHIIYCNGVNLNFRRVNLAVPTSIEAQQSLVNNLDAAAQVFDAGALADKIIVWYNSTTVGNYLRYILIDSNGLAGSGSSIAGSDQSTALAVLIDSLSRIIVIQATTTDVNYTILGSNLATTTVPITSIETITDVDNVGVVQTDTSDYHVYYQITDADTDKYFIRQCSVDAVGAVGLPSLFKRSVGLAAKPFMYLGNPYVITSFVTEVQQTYFVLDSAGTVIAKFLPGLGGPHSTGMLPNTFVNGSLVAVSSFIKTKLVADELTFFSVLGINVTRLNFAPTKSLLNAVLGENLHIAGGILQMYDGDVVVEHGFHVFPETVEAGAATVMGGFMSDGNYGYVAVYRWTDNYGQEHRSARSANLDVILSGGGTTQTQEIIIPTLRLTAKSDVVIELYRTENNGDIYYLTGTIANNPAVDELTIIDVRADSSLISQLPLYTTGGVLDNGPAPSLSVIGVHTASNRLMGVGENSNLLLYSKIRQQGQPVEWNESLQKVLDPIGGKVTAIASMDEKAVIFKEDAILFISGAGPNNLGEQDTFTEPERISVDVGCIEADSVVLTPLGLMFKSRKGIYLLNRSLQTEYIGAPVEEYNGLTITSAKIIGQFNHVRFTTSNGDCLVYSYDYNLWGTFTNHAALGAEVIGNDYYYVRSSSELYKENRTSFSDNGRPIKMLLEFGWLSFASLQGFQRAYKAMILGDWFSEHKLRIKVGYDFNEAWVQDVLIDPTPDIINPATYGSESPYGSGSPYGGDGNVYQARIDFAIQKCQSIKLQISDEQLVAGEGLSLSNISLQVGGKTGLFKPSQSKIFGAS